MSLHSNTLLTVLGQIQDCSLLLRLLNATDAKNFSLTCRALNALCFQACKSIKVPIYSCSNAAVASAIPRRFENCIGVECIITDEDELANAAMVLLPALSELPKLRTLTLQMNPPGVLPRSMAMLLELILLRMPSLESLGISKIISWEQDSLPWQALGKATQLKSLLVSFDTGYAQTVNMSHLSFLQPLGNSLRSLEVSGVELAADLQDYSFVGHLTSLTYLNISLASTKGLANISALVHLRHLHLDAGEQGQDGQDVPVFHEAEYDAMAQLTQLTELRLAKVGNTGSNEEFLAVLRALQQLKVLRLDGLCRHALPTLAKLTNLTELGSIWNDGDNAESDTASDAASDAAMSPSCVLEHVQSFGGDGPVPFQAIPMVKQVAVWGTWPPSHYVALGKHCKHVVSLQNELMFIESTSMPLDAPMVERVTAVQSLAKLQHLTSLKFAPTCDAEVALLSHITTLVELHVLIPNVRPQHCSALGLMHLCVLPGVTKLLIEVPGISIFRVFQARNLIVGLHKVANVTLYVREANYIEFTKALQGIDVLGLPKPSNLTIEGMWPDLVNVA